jgi:intracellular sulfur oxidation DsrE/DsrF family protein
MPATASPCISRRSLLAAGSLLFLAGSALAQAGAKPNRLVVQVSDADPGKWGLALNNTYNVMADLGADTTEVEIVVYGPGIGMLKAGSPVGDRIANAMKNGVKVVACENTMNGQHLTKADMLPNIGYVQAGVVELMKKQQQGWAYLRP